MCFGECVKNARKMCACTHVTKNRELKMRSVKALAGEGAEGQRWIGRGQSERGRKGE